MWLFTDYLQPRWFWDGLWILCVVLAAFRGIAWLLSWLRGGRDRRDRRAEAEAETDD